MTDLWGPRSQFEKDAEEDAARHIREEALRQAMALVSRLQPTMAVDWSGDQEAYRIGHRHARMQVYHEIERMIAREAPAPAAADREDDGDC